MHGSIGGRNQNMDQVIRVGIIGMGGFAGAHHDAIKRIEGEGGCKLICACDPMPGAFEDRMKEWDLSGRGVAVFDDYIKMLGACKDQLELVFIPTPVPLHAPMHRACIERGLPVYLEKPPTLDYAELDQMLAVETGAVKLTNVGFNYIIDSQRQRLKQRISNGEFGNVRRVCFYGLWPRPASYYQRAPWAGRLMLDGRLVLDSCMGNAMAHYIHNVLFWAGSDGLFSWGEVSEVEAELYRAHSIQGMDTVFAKAKVSGGIDVQVALSHACDGEQVNPEWVICDEAVIRFDVNKGYQIEWNDGTTETGEPGAADLYGNLIAHLEYLRGSADRPVTKLVDSRPFVQFCDLVYVAAQKITSVASEYIVRSSTPDGSGEYVAIKELANIVDQFFATDSFPSRQGISWARPGGTASVSDLPKLHDIIPTIV